MWMQFGMLWSMQMVGFSWHCAVTDARFKGIIVIKIGRKWNLLNAIAHQSYLSYISLQSGKENVTL